MSQPTKKVKFVIGKEKVFVMPKENDKQIIIEINWIEKS